MQSFNIATRLVTVDGVLDCQLDLLHTSTNYYNRVSQFYNHQLCGLQTRSPAFSPGSILDVDLTNWSRSDLEYSTVDYLPTQSRSHVTTDDQSVSKSWIRAPCGSRDRILILV
jgi:hypothetical protein